VVEEALVGVDAAEVDAVLEVAEVEAEDFRIMALLQRSQRQAFSSTLARERQYASFR